MPLVEIVSEPDLRSAAEAAAYLRAIRQLVRWLGISDGNMEEGSLRCDANVSVRPAGETKLGTKAELKNMNSFKHVEAAIEYEIARQSDLVRARRARGAGDAPVERRQGHLARHAHQGGGARLSLLPRAGPAAAAWSTRRGSRASRGELPELPLARWQRFQSLGLSAYDAGVLTAEKALADYFDAVVERGAPPKQAANWIMVRVPRRAAAAARSSPS